MSLRISAKVFHVVLNAPDYDTKLHTYRAMLESFEHKKFDLIVGQVERAPTTGSLHFDLFIKLKRATQGRWVRQWLKWTKGCRIIPMTFGTERDICKYALKDPTRFDGPWIITHDGTFMMQEYVRDDDVIREE